MARSSGFSLLRSALLGATVLALFQPALAQARVGVTSATDGDPKGKPPQEAERVLRIGIDVQANEIVTTGANDRAHLVFLDGTSVTVGPNARLTIDKFVYDPATKTGDLAITASKGVFRLVGGKISKNNPVTITTPSSTIGIRGGITVFTVTDGQTTSTFVFGTSMTVTGQGVTQTAFKPGFQVTSTAGLPPGPPRLVPPGGLSAAMSSLEGSGSGGSGAGGSGGNADGGAAGFGAGNSGTGPTPGGPAPGGTPPSITKPTNATPTTTTVASTIPVTGTRTNYIDNSSLGGTDTSLKGFTGGLVEQTNANQVVSHRILFSGAPDNVKIETATATNRASATIIVQNFGQGGATATFQLGGLSNNSGVSSAFIDDKTYFAIDQTTDPARLSKVTLPGGEQPIEVPIGSNTVLASAAVNPPPQPLGCTCDFLTWGTWSGEVNYTAQEFRPGERDRPINTTYVAGTLSPVSELNALFNAANLPGAVQQNFIATYNGGMVGSAQLGTNTYSAMGTYQNVWSFGARSGVVTGSFDGINFSGTTNLINQGPGFVGAMAVPTLAAGVLTINGAFYSSPTDAVKGQAGNFLMAGQRPAVPNGPLLNYQAAGTFAAQK